ncbi:DMT family transporter [Chakrabartyella piscis]|uniref:DMT family transporter n=1 Tax=Chakrabartyella piscis TaxID=2918914 RepID=UPI002958C5EF|nr:EamA family transporter [Chakrabartyella piscis]
MAYILVVIAGVSWGLIGLFTKALASVGLSELDSMAVKATVSAIAFVCMALVKDRSAFRLKHPLDILYFIGTGVCSFAFFSWMFMKTINLTSNGIAVVLLYTAPTIIMIYSVVVLKEQMTKKKALVLAMTLVGCALVSEVWQSETVMSLEGLLTGLASGVGYALYSIIGTKVIQKGYSSIAITTYTFLVAAIALLLVISPVELVQEISDKNAWLLLISFGLLTTVVPFFCYTKGLVNLPASVASVTATIEPVVGALLGIFVLKESASFWKIVGIVCIVGGVVLLSVNTPAKKNHSIEE